MDYTKYNYLIATADLKSISKAAEKCFITQPALTRCINKIEEELGVKLFDRSTTPLRLTYAGERYIAGIKNICAMKYQLDKEMEDISDLKKGRLNVGIPDTRGTTWLPQILPPFFEKYPGIDVRIVEGTTESLENSVLKEQIDLMIIGTLPITMPGLDYEVIVNEQLMLVLPRSHPIFDGNPPNRRDNVLQFVEAKKLDGQPYISLTSSQGLYKAGNLMFESHNIRPRTALEIVNTSTAFFLASEGLGFTICPVSSSYTERYAEPPIFCTLFDPPAERSLIATYKKGRPLSSSGRHFIDMVKYQATHSEALKVPRFTVVYDTV